MGASVDGRDREGDEPRPGPGTGRSGASGARERPQEARETPEERPQEARETPLERLEAARGPREEAGEGPRLPPSALVRMALRFYGLLFLAAWLWRTAWLGEPLLHAGPEAAARGVDPLRDGAAGLLAAGIVIGLSHQLTAHTRGGRALADGLARLLGPLETRHVVVLALVSGIAEEAFFRGALQPRVGLVWASLVFGLAHFVPRPEFRLWTVFSVAAGFLLGFLFEATGNLVAPVVAHVVVNGVNLTLLVRGGPWGDDPAPAG